MIEGLTNYSTLWIITNELHYLAFTGMNIMDYFLQVFSVWHLIPIDWLENRQWVYGAAIGESGGIYV